jgi:hypothetical protein
MTRAAGPHIGLSAVRDDVGHRRVIVGMPVWREEKIALLRDGERGRAVGNVSWHAVIGRGLEIRSPGISPRRK